MKGYILPLKGTQYNWCNQNKVPITQGKKKKVLVLLSTNVNQRTRKSYALSLKGK